ncbi:heterokaryon incompatibility protein-domain-containing protein [Xylaria telfairii]|nr:heterokaryon incompatibility protein-domain-containing protein [Xylaria telfairii]
MSLQELFEHNAPFYSYSLAQPANRDKIRILCLKPGDWDDPIECQLEWRYLSDDYWTLSYVWGDYKDHKSIRVNSQSDFWMTENAFTALRRLRWLDKKEKMDGIIIWIDAICINQADIRERNAQVAMMGDIYKKAKSVIIWLGNCVPLLPGQSEDIECADKTHETAVAMFMNSTLAWWQRCWTYQEFVLSENAYFVKGSHVYPFWYYFTDKFPEQLQPLLLQTRLPEPVSLFSLLAQTRRREATNPRDKVYSVLAACRSEGGNLVLEVDYAKSPGQIAYEACAVMLEQGHSIAYLHQIFGFAYSDTVVSWVPGIVTPCHLPYVTHEWNVEYKGDLLHMLGQVDHSWCSKHGPSGREEQKCRIQDKTLFVEGLLFEEVVQKVTRSQDGFADLDLESRLTTLAAIQDQQTQGQSELIKANRSLFDKINRRVSLKPKTKSVTDWHEIVAMIDTGAMLFFTRTGSIGIASSVVEIGDLVTVLFGFPRVIILRPCTSDAVGDTGNATISYRMVSEALVPSIEGGQLVDLFKRGRVTKQEFKIV